MRFQILFSLALAAVAVASQEHFSTQGQVAARNVVSPLERGTQPTLHRRALGSKRSKAPDGLLQGVGKLLAGIEKAAGVTALEDALDKTFGGQISDVEDSLGTTKLEQSLDLLKGCSKSGVVQYVGKLLKVLEDKLGVTFTEDQINKALGGKLVELEDKLGLTKAEDDGLGLGRRAVPDGLVQKLGDVLAGLEEKLGVTALESALDKALDGKVTDLEDSLGSNRAEKGAGLLAQNQTKKGLLQALGRLVATLEKDVGVTATEKALDSALGGKVTDLEDALGLTKLEKYLDLE